MSKAMETPLKEEYIKENTDYFNLKKYIKKENFLWLLA